MTVVKEIRKGLHLKPNHPGMLVFMPCTYSLQWSRSSGVISWRKEQAFPDRFYLARAEAETASRYMAIELNIDYIEGLKQYKPLLLNTVDEDLRVRVMIWLAKLADYDL